MTNHLSEGTSNRSFCSQYSQAAGEQLAGTVKAVDLWLLIEHRGRWERDAVSMLPDNLRQQISALQSEFPKMRVALIRQPTRHSGPLSLFWAFSKEREPQLFQAEFESHQELMLHPHHRVEPIAGKLFAVCTHGSHDLCCAQFGNKIYSHLANVTPDVWQISHVGGCRFAPNVVCFPDGIVYGRVEAEDCATIVSGYQQGNLVTGKLRGRCCYPKPVQAAEQFLRNAGNFAALDALHLQSAKQTGPRDWAITFVTADLVYHTVSVNIVPAAVTTYKSCTVSDLLPRDKFLMACT